MVSGMRNNNYYNGIEVGNKLMALPLFNAAS